VSKLSPSQMLASLDDACAGHCAPVHPGDAQAAGPILNVGGTLSAPQDGGQGLSDQARRDLLREAKADIRAFLDKYSVPYKIKTKGDLTVFELDQCPANPEHNSSAFLKRLDGGLAFKCFYNSCQGYAIDQAIIKLATGDDNYVQDTSLETKMAALNKDHAVVNLSGKCAILIEGKDPISKCRSVSFSSVGDLHNFQKNNFGRELRGDKYVWVPVSDRWFKWEGRREYKGVIFEPGQQLAGYYNLYQGFSVEPKPGDCSLYLDHIKNVIAAGNTLVSDYVKAWLADLLQNPGGPRPGTALALRGGQGCGKGTFVDPIGKILDPHFLHLSGSDQLTGRFNEHLKSKILVFADEAVWAGDKSAEGKLKAMITEPTLFVEPKGLNGFAISNHMRLILASNNDWIIPAGMDERRFLVLDVSSARTGDYEYFTSIKTQMANGGLQALLHYLLHYDFSGVNLRQIPRTRALFDQMLNSMSPFEKFWYDRLSGGRLFEMLINRILAPGENLREKYDVPWPDEVLVTDLCNEFQLFCREMNVRYRSSATQMGKSLSQICPPVQRKRHSTGPRDYYYQIPSLELCREAFEARVKMTIDWS
jgi:hypothetical protein